MISKEQILQMKTNIVLKPKVFNQIIQLWDTFSPAKRIALSELLGLADEAHNFLLQQAIERHPTFQEDLNNFIHQSTNSAFKSEENEDRETEEIQLEQLIQNIN